MPTPPWRANAPPVSTASVGSGGYYRISTVSQLSLQAMICGFLSPTQLDASLPIWRKHSSGCPHGPTDPVMQVRLLVAAASGPVRRGTTPMAVRFHDEHVDGEPGRAGGWPVRCLCALASSGLQAWRPCRVHLHAISHRQGLFHGAAIWLWANCCTHLHAVASLPCQSTVRPFCPGHGGCRSHCPAMIALWLLQEAARWTSALAECHAAIVLAPSQHPGTA